MKVEFTHAMVAALWFACGCSAEFVSDDAHAETKSTRVDDSCALFPDTIGNDVKVCNGDRWKTSNGSNTQRHLYMNDVNYNNAANQVRATAFRVNDDPVSEANRTLQVYVVAHVICETNASGNCL